uniref:Protein RER1 n=1 Tax=Rhabditophanes sp. KR3021 TaxID=114890 RepID=A0AC35UHY5_9BILA
MDYNANDFEVHQKPSFIANVGSTIYFRYKYYLDCSTPYVLGRWVVALFLSVIFCSRMLIFQSHFLICYALFIHYLFNFCAFLTPLSIYENDLDSEEQNVSLPTKNNDEFRPFIRRLPEFKFWLSHVKTSLVAVFLTFFDFFNVEVFWPVLVIYFVFTSILSFKRQIRHMIRHKYIPFNFNKPNHSLNKPLLR